MKIPLSFVQLHEALFLGGKNHQLKIFAGPDLSLTYDRENQELHVVYKDVGTIMPITAANSMQPIDPKAAGIDMKLSKAVTIPPPAPTTKIKAQVEMPKGLKL